MGQTVCLHVQAPTRHGRGQGQREAGGRARGGATGSDARGSCTGTRWWTFRGGSRTAGHRTALHRTACVSVPAASTFPTNAVMAVEVCTKVLASFTTLHCCSCRVLVTDAPSPPPPSHWLSRLGDCERAHVCARADTSLPGQWLRRVVGCHRHGK